MLLFDGPNLVWRSHFVGRDLSSRGRPTGVLHVGLSMIAGMTGLFEPQRVIFLWDSNPSWRVRIYPDYKANRNDVEREEERKAVHVQMAQLRQVLSWLGVWQLDYGGMEADDLAGILVGANNGRHKITLVSSDKDWFQLIGPKVEQVRGWSGKTIDRWDANKVVEKHGVHPLQWAEYLAMVGDKGDNIPNIRRGVGPVYAKKVLAGEKTLTDEEKRSLKFNMQLTSIRHLQVPFSINKQMKVGVRNQQSWKLLEKFLTDYELFSVYNERVKLWEVGGWR